MADLIISDLARWEDWEVTDKLVKIFKESKQENRWLRVPIVAFLMASPEPRAKDYLAELKKLDPGSIERAELFGGGFDDDEDDDSDVERDEADVDAQSRSDAGVESSTSVSAVSTTLEDDDLDPFAELEQEFNAETGTTRPKVQPRHTTFKIPLGSGMANRRSSGVTLSPDPIPVASADSIDSLDQSNIAASDEIADLSSEQNEPSPVALAAETSVTAPPLAAAAPVSPVASVPYLTFKIILIPFICSVALFFLLWSVFSGSFQRLIF
jgi:hypothetical protein